MIVDVFNVMQIIIANKNLMEIIMDNAYVKLAIMMIIQILYAHNALFLFGI